MVQETGLAPSVTLQIEDGPDFSVTFESFEWASFMNNGYMIKANIVDPYFNKLRSIATREYLKEARVRPTALTFKIQWAGADLEPTEKRIAYLAYLNGEGIVQRGNVEFIGVDPPSWWLNAGDADGSVWEGKVSKVIKDVIDRYTAPDREGITAEVADTSDSDNNQWWMMRQDPKTFISSLLDWSASLSENKTAWVVSSVDRKITIREQATLPDSIPAAKKDFGVFSFNTKVPAATDIVEFELLANNAISVFQTKLITQGISAVSGQFIDKITDTMKKKVFVDDTNTSEKLNVNIGPDRGYKKPDDKDWATNIISVPEPNAGELGIKYEDWVDGRARGMYMDMLNMVMRLRIRVHGDHRFDDSSILGGSTLTIAWKDNDENPYFLSGRWIIYGFHHVVDRTFWYTDLFLYRLDHNASAKKI